MTCVRLVILGWFCAFAGCRPGVRGGVDDIDSAARSVDTQGWSKVECKSFSYRIPSWMKQIDVHGTDSFVFRWEGDEGTTALNGDFGEYSNDLSPTNCGLAQGDATTSLVGNRRARVVVGREQPSSGGRYVVAAAWREVQGPMKHLTVFAKSRSDSRLPELMAILRSFEFR